MLLKLFTFQNIKPHLSGALWNSYNDGRANERHQLALQEKKNRILRHPENELIYSKKENLGSFNILFELFMIWMKKNAISFLADLKEDYKLYELLGYWDKYSDRYYNLNIFNLSREELLLNIHRDVWRLSNREIDG